MCSQDAVERDDLSLVVGVPRAYREGLLQAGIATAHELAACDVEAVARSSGISANWLRSARWRAEARMSGRPMELDGARPVDGGVASIALTWQVDLFSPSRPVVAVGYQVRSANGELLAPEVKLAPFASEATGLAAGFVRRVEDLAGRMADARLLVGGDSRLADLAGTAVGAEISWASRLVDIRSAARSRWAFPGAVRGPADMVAQLRSSTTMAEALPFVAEETDHPALMYRRYSERADGAARRSLVDHLAEEMAALHELYRLLRGAG